MRKNLGKVLTVSAMTMTVLAGTSAYGFADTPAENTKAGLGIPVTTGDPSNGPSAEHCQPKNMYKPTKNHGKSHKGLGATQANQNNTSRTARSWFKAETGGEVKLEISGQVKVSGGVLVAQLENTYGVDLSMSLTAKVGNEIQVDTPPKKTTYGRYGVWRMKNEGVSYYIYSNCRTSAKQTVTSYTPWYVGWNLWEK